MPHGIIGYAGSTLRAAQIYVETLPRDNLTVLIDYYGREYSDALDVCRWWYNEYLPRDETGASARSAHRHARRALRRRSRLRKIDRDRGQLVARAERVRSGALRDGEEAF